MSRFREQLKLDIERVFFNLDEFAEIHQLEGKNLNCIIVSDAINKHTFNKIDSFGDGLVKCDLEVMYKHTEYPYQLANGTRINFDKLAYYIIDFENTAGVCHLKLEKITA